MPAIDSRITQEYDKGYTLGYNPRLDGLRALAAIFVLLTHYEIPGFASGLYGVNIFFVLSGYLITGVLLKETSGANFLGRFYWRRFLRLMPALAGLSLFLCALALVFPNWINRETVRDDVIFATLYVANWTEAFSLGSPMYLSDCWSLAIEEQFYLLWPLVFIFIAHKKRQLFLLLSIALLLVAASLAWTFFLEHYVSYDRVYRGFDTRCSDLLIGCCLALAGTNARFATLEKPSSRAWPFAVVALALLVSNESTWTPGAGLIADFATVVLIQAAYHAPDSLICRLLATRPVVAIGKASYSLYLWHLPIMLIMKVHLFPQQEIIAIGIPLSFVAAFVSYRFIEQPALRLRNIPERSAQKLGVAAVSFSVVGMLGGGGFAARDYVADYLSYEPTLIDEYSPHVIKVGESFNVQPNGQSCLWMKASRVVPEGSALRIGSTRLQTLVSGRSIVAFLPRELLMKAKKSYLTLVNSKNEPIAPSVPFLVTAE